VYELPDMTLLDKKSHKLEGVQDFAWSPSQPILCAYQTEQAGGNLPARISLIGFPDKKELRQKNLFSVSGTSPLVARVPLCGDPRIARAPS
jgi:translation initiation factor 3 subunit B